MELTWIAIAASLLMGGGALLIFVWAIRSRQFHRFEDVKYQVFWSDAEELTANRSPARATQDQATETQLTEEEQHGSTTKAN